MKQVSYHEQDLAFGQAMLTLRTAIGLTQVGLAEFLGISRRAVGDWESGSKYPKAANLKQMIVLAIQYRAFPAGREAEAIRALWQVARQKVLLDEAWLAALLAPTDAPLATQPVKVIREAQALAPPTVGPRVDWGDALAVPTFYGREWELTLLTRQVLEERCRVVSVLGFGGIGKSALVVNLMHRLAEQFEVVIWRSLRDAPACEDLLEQCIQVLAPRPLGQMPPTLEQRLNLLLEYLRGRRAMLVLDNLETVLEEGERSGHMRPGYEGYGQLLRRIAETEHQSCLLLTSREKPHDLALLEGNQSPVRVLRLAWLQMDACQKLLAEKGVMGSALEQTRLIEAYGGNPLALKIVAQTIFELFGGEIAPFLEQGAVIFGGIRELLNEQFARLSALEECLLLWLAILREPSTLEQLAAVMVTPVPRARVLEAIESLHRRSLIERGQLRGSFTLQSVVLEYATTRLIAQATSEIEQGKLAYLIEHGLELAQVSEYVRQTQERLIATPILANLRSQCLQQPLVEEQLVRLLGQLANWHVDSQGYGPANLVTLLRRQRGSLRGVDLSKLALRGMYLQGVEMQDAILSQALIQDTVFTQTFGATTAITISSSGAYFASSSQRGEVWVWVVGSLTLRRVWRAHADLVRSLMFSPDERTLVSGSWDGIVKLWDVASGTLLWSSGRQTNYVNSVAFAPDGSMIASSGIDATVRLWDTQSGTQLQVLEHPEPTISVTWSPDGYWLASGDIKGTIRLWEIEKTGPATCIETLAGHTTWVDSLAFAPDAGTLASASWDSTVKLWDTSTLRQTQGKLLRQTQGRLLRPSSGQVALSTSAADGRLRQTLTGHTERVISVVWSPDGRTLASCSRDPTIWLWDVERGSYQAALQGHTASVDGLAFTPDGHNLLSGSEDGTLRVWDIASRQCIRILQGYTATLNDIDWSPDSTQLVSGGSDKLVTLFDVTGERPPRVLHGHSAVVFGVGWSPDGLYLASSEFDNSIRLWDPNSGACLQVLQHPDDPGNYFYGLAWSPDGQWLACGTYRCGVQVFEPNPRPPYPRPGTAHGRRWVGQQFPTWIRHVAWSPDGTQVAGGGDDGTVYVWDATEGTLLRRLAGHHSMITRVAWSPNGTRLASVGSGREDGELFVWDAQREERVGFLVGHPGIVFAVAWGSDEEWLISGGGDGMLRWWDVQRGECLWEHKAHQGTVLSLRRSPDGTKLASCSDDGAIMLWDLHSGEYLQTLRRDRPYERLNITGIRGLGAAQKMTLRVLGAIEDDPMQSSYHTHSLTTR